MQEFPRQETILQGCLRVNFEIAIIWIVQCVFILQKYNVYMSIYIYIHIYNYTHIFIDLIISSL